MSLAGCQIIPIDLNFHLQKCLETFDKNSADKIQSKNYKEVNPPCFFLWFDNFFYLKAIGAEVQPPPRAGGEASSDDGFRRILTTFRESVEAELDVTGTGELCTGFVAGTMSISTVLLWAGDTRISGWVQSISTVLPDDSGAVKK